jgi:TonB family protein
MPFESALGTNQGLATDATAVERPSALVALNALAPVQRDGVTRPVRLESSAVLPRYETLSSLDPVQASVLLSVVVRADGTVGDVRLLEVKGAPADVAIPAIEAVKQWRYQPAAKDGQAVDARIAVLVDFSARR